MWYASSVTKPANERVERMRVIKNIAKWMKYKRGEKAGQNRQRTDHPAIWLLTALIVLEFMRSTVYMSEMKLEIRKHR